MHRFTLNAYDVRTPGPNAPLPWIEATLEHFSDVHREKILFGLPFYGYDNQGKSNLSPFQMEAILHAYA